MTVDRKDLEHLISSLPQAGRIPRKDGELAFDTPWEIRALGIAVAAHQQGHYQWDDFQRGLMRAIRDWEETPPEERGDWRYYERWVQALEHLAVERGLVDPDEYAARTEEYLSGQRDPRHGKK